MASTGGDKTSLLKRQQQHVFPQGGINYCQNLTTHPFPGSLDWLGETWI